MWIEHPKVEGPFNLPFCQSDPQDQPVCLTAPSGFGCHHRVEFSCLPLSHKPLAFFTSPFGMKFIRLVLSPKVIFFPFWKFDKFLLSHFHTVEAWSRVSILWKLFSCFLPTASQIVDEFFFFNSKFFMASYKCQNWFFFVTVGYLLGSLKWCGEGMSGMESDRLQFESNFSSDCFHDCGQFFFPSFHFLAQITDQ